LPDILLRLFAPSRQAPASPLRLRFPDEGAPIRVCVLHDTAVPVAHEPPNAVRHFPDRVIPSEICGHCGMGFEPRFAASLMYVRYMLLMTESVSRCMPGGRRRLRTNSISREITPFLSRFPDGFDTMTAKSSIRAPLVQPRAGRMFICCSQVFEALG
jgi:hypothetical protein